MLPTRRAASQDRADAPLESAAEALYVLCMNIVSELRHRAGLTQDLLARLSGVSSSSISRYETGERSPTLSTLARLVAAAEFDAVVSFAPSERDNGRNNFACRLDGEPISSPVAANVDRPAHTGVDSGAEP